MSVSQFILSYKCHIVKVPLCTTFILECDFGNDIEIICRNNLLITSLLLCSNGKLLIYPLDDMQVTAGCFSGAVDGHVGT